MKLVNLTEKEVRVFIRNSKLQICDDRLYFREVRCLKNCGDDGNAGIFDYFKAQKSYRIWIAKCRSLADNSLCLVIAVPQEKDDDSSSNYRFIVPVDCFAEQKPAVYPHKFYKTITTVIGETEYQLAAFLPDDNDYNLMRVLLPRWHFIRASILDFAEKKFGSGDGIRYKIVPRVFGNETGFCLSWQIDRICENGPTQYTHFNVYTGNCTSCYLHHEPFKVTIIVGNRKGASMWGNMRVSGTTEELVCKLKNQ